MFLNALPTRNKRQKKVLSKDYGQEKGIRGRNRIMDYGKKLTEKSKEQGNGLA